MKFFHTADWHLGKLVQGVYMTEDQQYVLEQLIEAIVEEKPDAIIIAGDLYDRSIPPTEAVHLLNETFEKIVLDLQTPILAIAGNHDSPSRLHFGSKIMQKNGLHIVGQFKKNPEPIILEDEFGEIHFHLIPYCEPSVVRNELENEEIRTHDDAMKAIVEEITEQMDSTARHVVVSHSFVTPLGRAEENTSESERPLSIGGSEYVNANHFLPFHYTALGHLHQAHYVEDEKIRYAGSILKYSISEEKHKKGFYIVDLDDEGKVEVEKRLLAPKRDMRTVEATLEELYTHPESDDYVFVKLLDETPVLSPMEKVKSVYKNAMHVERKQFTVSLDGERTDVKRSKMSDVELFQSFYKEVKGSEPEEEAELIFKEALEELLKKDNESSTGS
jgi:exonuclease SbcD